MDYRTNELLKVGNRLFSQKASLDNLWQEIAENFYPERAEFTRTRDIGEEFAGNLTSSYPIIARRSLGDLFSSMLRPMDKLWFAITAKGGSNENDLTALQYLEFVTNLQRNAMYDSESGFVRATKEADHDYAAFGNAVISTEMNWNKMALLYRCHHLRDVVWCEDVAGTVERIDNKWKPTIRDIARRFKNIHPEMQKEYETGDMYRQVECRHIVLPSDAYESSYKEHRTGKSTRYKQPWVSVYIDTENDHILEEVGSWTRVYTIPRWQTVSGSQYSYSPATVAALPDARLYQAIALTILEAGEKYTNPPMIATKEAIRGDVNLYAGGVTWAEGDYDERLGEVLRPISQDRGSLGIGTEIQQMIKMAIHEAFFLNKVNLPDRGSAEMTAYEAAQRTQEYIRDALPIFEPTTSEYNGTLCEITFDTLKHAGAFGSPEMMPPQLRGKDIEFKFENPLLQAEDRMKSQQFMGALGLIGQAAGVDPSAANIMNIKESLKDAIIGSGTPTSWLRNNEEIAMIEMQQAQEAQQAQLMQGMQQGADIIKTASEAGVNVGDIMGAGKVE